MMKIFTLCLVMTLATAGMVMNEAAAQCAITIDPIQCVNAPPVELGPYPPSGGSFTGTGTTASSFDPFTGTTMPATFDPAAAGIGTHPLTYTFNKKYYIDQSGTFAPEDISATGTEVTFYGWGGFENYDDGVSLALPIGFDFNFFGSIYSSFYLSTNGVIKFVSGPFNGFNTNLSLAPDNIIAFLWDDWDNDMRFGSIKYETIGIAPDRVLIVDYYNIAHYNDDFSKKATVQVKLFETTNVIEIHTTDAYTSSATQGIKGTTALVPQDIQLDTWIKENYGIDYYNVIERYNTDWGYGGNAVNDFVAFIPQADCSVTVDVEVVGLPNVDAGLDQEVCYGEMVTLSGAGADSYVWDNGITDGIAFQALATTTYMVAGTDVNGCSVNDAVTVTVKPLPVIETVTSSTSICPGDEVTLTATGDATFVWDNGVINGQPFVPGATTTYTVTATGANLCETTAEVIVTVNPAQGPVTAASSATTINGGETVTLTGSGAVDYSWSHGATDGVAFMPNGTTTFELTGFSEFGCTATDQITVTVIKSDQTLTFGPLPSKTYGDAPFDPGATATSGLAPQYVSSDESVVSISGGRAVITGAGTATITASQPGDGNYNPAPSDVPQSITVAKAPQTITFNLLAEAHYETAPFGLTASSSSGLAPVYVSSDETVATIAGNTVTVVGVGTATITASQPGDANYLAATSVEQTLTVVKADQTITFAAFGARVVTDGPFALGAGASSGLPVVYASSDETVATVDGSTVTITGVGSATITASQAGDANYNASTDVQQTLVVNKAPQTITFGALADRLSTEAPFDLTATASSGLGVTYASSDTTVITVSGTTVTITGSGKADIIAIQAGDGFYAPAPGVRQAITINKTDQTIDFPVIEDQILQAGTMQLAANASSGLDVTYKLKSGPATVEGNIITFTGLGTVTVRAIQTGDNLFNAADQVELSFNIVTITSINAWSGGIRVYPNPATNYINLLGEYSGLEIRDVRGVLVLSSSAGRERIDVSHLRPGVYVAVLFNKKGEMTTQKLIKK